MKSPVVQSDDYYPFGLTFNSYQRENSEKNRWKFQGQEHIDDLDLGWDSFKWRNHMPDIGRFFNVDPLAEKYVYNSPYAFSENCVTSHVELEGLEKVHFTIRQYDTGKNTGSGEKTIEKVDPKKLSTHVNFTLDMGKQQIVMRETDTSDNPFLFGQLKAAAETGSPRGVDFEPELTVGEDGSFSVHGDLSYWGATDVNITVRVTEKGLEITTNIDDISPTKSVAVFAGDETRDIASPAAGNSVLIANTTPREGIGIADKELNQKTTIPLVGDASQSIVFDENFKKQRQSVQASTVLEIN